jgi:hypothetical protein
LRDTDEQAADYRTRLVIGCGKQITYNNECDNAGNCRSGPSYWSPCLHCEWTEQSSTPNVK